MREGVQLTYVSLQYHFPLFFNKLSILYFNILLYVEIYIPLVENYKYIRRNLHAPCRKLKMKSFICRKQQMKKSKIQNVSNLYMFLFTSAGMQKRFLLATYQRKKTEINPEYLIICTNNSINHANNAINHVNNA